MSAVGRGNMNNLVCTRMWDYAVASDLVDGAGRKGQLGGPRTSLHALTLVGCVAAGGSAQKGLRHPRALLTVSICVSTTVAASVRKTGEVPSQSHSCVVRTGGRYAGDDSGTLRRDSGNRHRFVFFGVEAAGTTSEMPQRSYTGTSIAVNNWQSPAAIASVDGEQKQTQQGQQAQSGHLPVSGDLFTHTAIEEALSLLEENPRDMTEVVGVERPCCAERTVEKGFVPHDEAAPERLGESNVAGEYSGDGVSGKYPVGMEMEERDEQQAEEEVDVLEQVEPEAVLPDLFLWILRLHWDPDGSKSNTAGEIFNRYGALPTVHNGTDDDVTIEDDLVETVGESIVPTHAAKVGTDPTASDERSEPRLASVPHVAVLIAGWLMAVALALAHADLDPNNAFVKQTSQQGRHDGRHVSAERKDIAKDEYLELDRVVGSQSGRHDERQVSSRKEDVAKDVYSGLDHVVSQRKSNVFAQHIARL